MKKLLSLFLLVSSCSIFAATLNNITLADKVTVEGKELVLNGMGIRKATIFKVKVYYGGLYLEQKSKDAQSFLNSNGPKQITMHFVHDVDAKKLRSTFEEAFEAANKTIFTKLKPQLEKFNANVADVVSGDEMIITFTSTGVTLTTKGKTFEKIPDAEFSRALLNIWFTNPLDEGLRSGLLGL